MCCVTALIGMFRTGKSTQSSPANREGEQGGGGDGPLVGARMIWGCSKTKVWTCWHNSKHIKNLELTL